MSRILVSSLAAAALLAGLAGCSSDNGASTANSTTSLPPAPKNANTEVGLTEAATDYFTAGNENKVPEQYVVLSARCKGKWTSVDAWKGNVDAARNILAGLGYNLENATVDSVTPEAFTPETSTVKAVIKTSDGKAVDALATTKWVYEDGGWRSDSCDSAMGN